MLQRQLFCLHGCILGNRLLRLWNLLHHSKLQTPNLVLNVLVVLLCLTALDDLGHQSLQFGVFNGLRVLHGALLGYLVMWVATCCMVVSCHLVCSSAPLIGNDECLGVNLL